MKLGLETPRLMLAAPPGPIFAVFVLAGMSLAASIPYFELLTRCLGGTQCRSSSTLQRLVLVSFKSCGFLWMLTVDLNIEVE
jgi:hypothetical protein